jgi:hypothetical protein
MINFLSYFALLGSTYNQPKPAAPAYGWNVPGTNAAAKPVGPPPSYPGLNNQAVPSYNKPPAYSPSYSNPPAYSGYSHPSAYSPSNSYKPSTSWTQNSPSYSRPSYSTGSGYYGNNYNSYQPNYGSTFGSHGLPGNTYISNNYYGNSRTSGGSGFLTNALFYGAGMHSGYMWGNRNSYRDNRRWDEEEDRRWRATTKAPYFENKVPGSEVILPAAAVVGAATAFGLASLLPLNVPSNKPLIYCNQNSSDIAQAQILINGRVYQCINETILYADISCPKSIENNETSTLSPAENIESTTDSQMTASSINKTQINCNEEPKIMQCDTADSIYCMNGTLMSRIDIFCNSTTLLNGTTNLNNSMLALTCYEGLLQAKLTAFIPTTTTTEAPITTTQKSLSFAAKTHLFFLRLIGKGDAVKKPETTTTPIPEEIPQQSIDESPPAWVPEALTIPPDTTTEPPTTSTTQKMVWMMKSLKVNEDGKHTLTPVHESLQTVLESTYAIDRNNWMFADNMYTRVVSTTEAPKNLTENIQTSTETPVESTTV